MSVSDEWAWLVDEIESLELGKSVVISVDDGDVLVTRGDDGGLTVVDLDEMPYEL